MWNEADIARRVEESLHSEVAATPKVFTTAEETPVMKVGVVPFNDVNADNERARQAAIDWLAAEAARREASTVSAELSRRIEEDRVLRNQGLPEGLA